MAEGLQIFNNLGFPYYNYVTVDLSSYLSKYLGETDIIPTSETGKCSGEIVIPGPKLPITFPGTFYVIDKIYAPQSDINLLSKTKYVLPLVMIWSRVGGEHSTLKWDYDWPDVDEETFDNIYNLGIHIKYGCF